MAFRGWPAEALEFYDGLEADNSKTYWVAHKAVYDDVVRAPMQALLDDLEPQFGPGRIYRPYRDVRFSADKTPYKTSIAGSLDRGGYVTLSARGLGAGNGIYLMAPDQLARYRRAVDGDATGTALQRVVATIEQQQGSVIGHDVLKTAPRGYPRDHPRSELLRYKGIAAWREWPPGAWLGRPSAKQRVIDFLRISAPLKAWLDAHVGPSLSPR